MSLLRYEAILARGPRRAPSLRPLKLGRYRAEAARGSSSCATATGPGLVSRTSTRCRPPSSHRYAASAARRRPARSARSLPQMPTPSSSFRSLPTIETRVSTSGPLPISVAPLIGRPSLAVLDQVGLARGEHELARGDVDLAAAEVHRVNALLDRAMMSSGSCGPGACTCWSCAAASGARMTRGDRCRWTSCRSGARSWLSCR